MCTLEGILIGLGGFVALAIASASRRCQCMAKPRPAAVCATAEVLSSGTVRFSVIRDLSPGCGDTGDASGTVGVRRLRYIKHVLIDSTQLWS